MQKPWMQKPCMQKPLVEQWIAEPATPDEIELANRLTIALWVILTAVAVAIVTL